MVACDKFTTGFDGKNMEFGISLRQSEVAYRIQQKFGRFSRDNKENQDTAYFYQFCHRLF